MKMKSNDRKVILGNIFFLALLQVVNYVFPLLSWPIMSNALGLSDFGVLLILLSICGIANMFTDFGFDLSATYSVSKNIKDKSYIDSLLSNVFFIKLLLSIVVILCSFLYIYTQISIYSSINAYTYLIISLIIVSQSCQYIWFFQGVEKMKYITLATVLSKSGYLILLLIIMPIFQSVNSALVCFLISQVVVSVTHIRCIYKENFSFGKVSIGPLISELKKSLGFFLSRIAVSLYTSANTLILGHFQGSAAAGLYGAAEKLYFAGSRVSGVLSQALYPNMAKTGNVKLLVKIVSSIFIPFCFCCYAVSFFSSEIMEIIFGAEFASASNILDLFLLLMCITFLSISLGYPGFAAIKKVEFANYSVVIGSFFHLCGIGILFYQDSITTVNLLTLVIITESIILTLRVGFLIYFSRKGYRQ